MMKLPPEFRKAPQMKNVYIGETQPFKKLKNGKTTMRRYYIVRANSQKTGELLAFHHAYNADVVQGLLPWHRQNVRISDRTFYATDDDDKRYYLVEVKWEEE